MKSRLTGTGATNHQYIFVDIIPGLFISSYHNPFGLGEQNVLAEIRVNIWFDVFRGSP